MNGGCEDRRLVEVFQEHILWQALLLEVLNLRILLPENNLLSGLFGLWTVEFFPTNSIAMCVCQDLLSGHNQTLTLKFCNLNPVRCYITGGL